MMQQEGREAGAADFLLTFKQEYQIERNFTLFTKRLFDTQHVRHHLPLVISGAPGPDFPIADDGFEGITLPKLQRIDRLHIVVTIDQNRATSGHMGVSRNHDRVLRRFMKLGRQAHARELVDEPLRTSPDIGGVP
jgi:hypothetical protein